MGQLMATAKPKANDAELNLDLEVPKKSKGKLLIILLLAVVLLGAGGGAAWWFLIHQKAADTEQQAETEGEEAETPEGEAAKDKKIEPAAKVIAYMPLDEQLVVNLRSESGRERILAFKLTFILTKAENTERVNGQLPAIKAELLAVLAAMSVEQLQQPEAIESLKTQVLQRLQARLIELIGEPAIERILFTSFLMQ